jgi:hypothetical protein
MRMKVMIFLLRRGSVQGLKGLLPKLQETWLGFKERGNLVQ